MDKIGKIFAGGLSFGTEPAFEVDRVPEFPFGRGCIGAWASVREGTTPVCDSV